MTQFQIDWSKVVISSLQSQLSEILSQAPADFTANIHGMFSDHDLDEILKMAQQRFYDELSHHPARTSQDLAVTWNLIVSDFHRNQYWGFLFQLSTKNEKIPATNEKKFAQYLRMFLVPTLALKATILYFGLNYSRYPDQGYGWGLLLAIIASIFNLGLFLWKTRNDTDE